MEDAAAEAPASGFAALFGLSAEEGRLVETLCAEALAEGGVGSEELLGRLRRGDSIGSAMGLTPPVLDAIYARAHRWFAVGYPERAEPLFRALCSADPTSADYWMGFGICLRLSGQVEAARMAFETAARLRPDWAVPPFHLGELSMVLNDIEGAAGHLRTFRALANDGTPASMRTEAARLEQAVAIRRQG